MIPVPLHTSIQSVEKRRRIEKEGRRFKERKEKEKLGRQCGEGEGGRNDPDLIIIINRHQSCPGEPIFIVILLLLSHHQ